MNDNIKKELRRDSGINGLLLLIFWILYYIIDLVAPLAAKIFEKNTSSPQYSTIERLIFYIFMYPVGFTLILTLFRKINKGHDDKKLSSCFCKPRTSPGWTIKWIILTIGSAYAASFISNIIYMLFRLITGVTLAEATLTNDGGALGTFTIIRAVRL